MLVVLVAGLGYQQLFRSSEHAAREQRQTQRRLVLPASRGVIYDRDQRVLAVNRPRTDAVINLSELRTGAATAQSRLAVIQRHLDRVNALNGRQDPVDASRLERAYAHDRTTPFVLARDLSNAEADKLSMGLAAADPVRLQHIDQRWYPQGATAAHLLGRVRRTLSSGEEVRGLGGIEQQHETLLSGQPGEAIVQVDAWGFAVGPATTTREPVAGVDVTLSLDLDLQLVTERALAESPALRGSVAVIAVETGEVLALSSKPGYDLNVVSPTMTTAVKQHIDAEGGWFNHATQGLYPPGSVFKIFTALAGLRGNTLQPDTALPCPGYLELGGRRLPCHNPGGHGSIRLRDALAHSCNVFAYQAGLAAGADALAAEARRFHLGEPTGLDLPAEASRMLVPDPLWKEQAGHGPWMPGDTANLAIGQGFLRCSPLQLACAVASLARRETLTVPTLLRSPGRKPSGDRPAEPLGLTDADYAALLAGLRAVVESGIGRDAQVPGISIAGKTGTAQVTRPAGTFNIAWFVAFAPIEKPQIALAVALEGARPNEEFAGAAHAAPVVREIIGAYFDKLPVR
ncbi:peptidoglycan D,D-transpeptidase FtsI family protein [Oleiharenicola lentus]|nr:penicillin-binding transpeptidase domain-containing protein [Oleiharenicola lentus]